jgi:hypothetical protein
MVHHFALESRAIRAKMAVSEHVRNVLVNGKNKGVGHPRFFRVLKGVWRPGFLPRGEGIRK